MLRLTAPGRYLDNGHLLHVMKVNFCGEAAFYQYILMLLRLVLHLTANKYSESQS